MMRYNDAVFSIKRLILMKMFILKEIEEKKRKENFFKILKHAMIELK